MTDYLDEPVEIHPDHPLRLSADAVRALTKATGRSMSELLQDEDDEANRLQVVAFAELYRRAARAGHLPDPATLWEMAGRADLEYVTATLDPTGAASLETSQPSADTGA